MKFELSDNKIIKDCFEAISTIIDEVSLECDSDGLRLRALDRSHISFVELDLKKTLFDEYTCETPEKINIDSSELMKILKRMKSSDRLIFENDLNNLMLTFEGDSTRKFNIRLIDTEYETPNSPAIDSPVELEIPVNVLNDFLGDVSVFGENISFIVDEDYFICKGSDDFGDSELKYIHGTNVKECVKSKFTINMINNIMKARNLAKEVTLKLGTDMPLILSFNIGLNDGKLEFLLAPRLEADTEE